jgi:hypothetical protein
MRKPSHIKKVLPPEKSLSASRPIQKKVLPPGRLALLDFPGGRTFFCMGVRAAPVGELFFVWDGSHAIQKKVRESIWILAR